MTLLLGWLKTRDVWLKRREDGQDLLEYGLLVSLIAIVAVAAVSDLADTIIDVFWGQISALDLL